MLARLIIAAAFVFVSFWGVALAAGDIFTVRNVAVDATADNAAQARDTAIADGQRTAYQLLMQRLTRQRDWGEIPQVTTDGLANLLLGFQVTDEHSSSTHYLAKVTYSFRADKVRELLQNAGISYSESRSKPALLLAAFGPTGQTILWGVNPWRDTWAKRDLGDDLVPLILPAGDGEDASLVSAGTAQSASWSQLAPIARKYGADRVVVASAAQSASGLNVRVRQVSVQQDRTSEFSIPPSDDAQAQLDQGVDGALARIGEDWKAATIVTYGQQNTMLASITFSSLQEWLSIRRRLDKVPTITSIEVLAMSVQGAELRLRYAGSADQLRAALELLSLHLDSEGSSFVIRTAEAGPQPTPASLQAFGRALTSTGDGAPAQ